MRTSTLLIPGLLLLAACEEFGDVDPDLFEIPDIRGSYDASFDEPAGCDGRVGLLAWAEGPLEVSGAEDSPTFAFEQVSLQGTVTEAFRFQFFGEFTWQGEELSVHADGTIYTDNDLWVLDGDLEVIADDGVDDCEITASFLALENP